MTLGGVTASSLGLIVREMPRFSITEPTGTAFSVAGRHGTLFLPDGGYAPVTATARLLMPASCNESAVRAWCVEEGDLILSDDPQRLRHVRVQSTFSRYAPGVQLLTMRLTGNPFRAELSPTKLAISTSATTFSGCGDVPSHPDIEVDGVGTITVTLNGVTITLSGMVAGQKVHIDCENRIAYKVSDESFATITLTSGAWPECGITTNTVQCAGTLVSAYLWPNWKWK